MIILKLRKEMDIKNLYFFPNTEKYLKIAGDIGISWRELNPIDLEEKYNFQITWHDTLEPETVN